MSGSPMTSRVLLGGCEIVHPIRHQPPAVSRQIHAPRNLEAIGIGRQLMAAKPACYEMTFRIALSAPSEPPSENVAAILQFLKEGICGFPVSTALDPSREPEGLVHKRKRVFLFQMF